MARWNTFVLQHGPCVIVWRFGVVVVVVEIVAKWLCVAAKISLDWSAHHVKPTHDMCYDEIGRHVMK